MNLEEQKKQIEELYKEIAIKEVSNELLELDCKRRELEIAKKRLSGKIAVSEVSSELSELEFELFKLEIVKKQLLRKLERCKEGEFERETKEVTEQDYMRAKLIQMEDEYYNNYFNESTGWLTNIPRQVNLYSRILDEYSNLNVDAIGDLICKLYRDNEGKRLTCVRRSLGDPKLFITKQSNAKKIIEDTDYAIQTMKDEDSIIISYSQFAKPVCDWLPENQEYIKKYYNEHGLYAYSHLINYGSLTIDYKSREFIKELIFSLSNYQRENDITYMTGEETNKVFKKIYKKR